jgi:hypothetical protein
MTDRIKMTLLEPVQAHKVLTQQIWPLIKASLMAGHRMVVEVKPETRSLAENAKLHALLTDISKQLEWAGSKRDVETWKRLLTAAWCRAIGEQIEMLPAIDGHGVDIVFRRTSQLTKSECADLIEFVQAWAIDSGVKLSAERWMYEN